MPAVTEALNLAMKRDRAQFSGYDEEEDLRRLLNETRVSLTSGARGISNVRNNMTTPLIVLLAMVGLLLIDRLREHRQPAARARDQPSSRDGHPPVDRRGTRTARASAPHREPAARLHRRRARTARSRNGAASRWWRSPRAARVRRISMSARIGASSRSRWGVAAHRLAVRPDARVPQHARAPRRDVEVADAQRDRLGRPRPRAARQAPDRRVRWRFRCCS